MINVLETIVEEIIMLLRQRERKPETGPNICCDKWRRCNDHSDCCGILACLHVVNYNHKLCRNLNETVFPNRRLLATY